jgi:hypothetical protein
MSSRVGPIAVPAAEGQPDRQLAGPRSPELVAPLEEQVTPDRARIETARGGPCAAQAPVVVERWPGPRGK